MATYSCKGCSERTEDCHATCSKYIQEKKEHDKYMEEYRKSKNKVITEYDFDSFYVRRRRKRKW